MRDLGVLIDEKLTFAEHVDAVVRRANRALGLLVRTFQTGKHGRSFDESMTKPIIGTFCANVRSILEFGSVVWGGAAATHMNRVERIQHKFLMWLCARSRVNNVTLEYGDLLQCFGLCTLAARREQHDVMFIRNIHRQAIDSSFLLSQFPLAAPGRLLRNRNTSQVPRARVNTVKNGLFARIPELSNRSLVEPAFTRGLRGAAPRPCRGERWGKRNGFRSAPSGPDAGGRRATTPSSTQRDTISGSGPRRERPSGGRPQRARPALNE